MEPSRGLLRSAVALLVFGALSSCSKAGPGPLPTGSSEGRIPLSSPNFDDAARMPARFTCDGEDVSPTVVWSAVPNAAEYALTMIDVDAPGGGFVHWLVYGIPGEDTSLAQSTIPEGAMEGENSFGERGYAGPCPPPGDGPHRYVFTLYRLSSPRAAQLAPGATVNELLIAIRCCVMATGTLTGTYERG
jgi:Raf kinase inhibitor-like YbhB/YbcL family protein